MPGLLGLFIMEELHLLQSYAVRGFIWYQAESNCGTGEDPRDYAHKMRASSWLENGLGNSDLPFYFVQLPQWKSYAWTYAREEQRRALDVSNTGMVVTIDLISITIFTL